MTAGPLRLRGAARRWGWLLLLALAPLFLFMSPATTPALLVVPALLALLWVTGGPDRTQRTPLDWPLLLLAVMVLVSLWATFSIAFSLPKIAGLVFGLGLFYAAVAHGRSAPGGWVAVAAAYLALGAGVAGIGLLGTRWSAKIPVLAALAAHLPGDLISLPGAESGLQPNEVAGVLVWVTPVAAALAVGLWLHFDGLLQARGGPATTAAVVSVTLVALASGGVLVLTQSRSALLGLALALLTMLLLAGRRLRRVTLALLAIGLLAAVVLYGQRIKALYDYAAYGTAVTAEPGRFFAGLDQRVEIWSRGVYGIEDFAITGMGLNTFRVLVFKLYPMSSVSPTVNLGHAHNTWLQVALDLGLPGLVAYVAVWIIALRMLLQVLSVTSDGWRVTSQDPPRDTRHATPVTRALALGILGAFAGSFGYGLTDTVALGARPGFLWWLLLALAVLVWRQSQPAGVYLAAQTVAPITNNSEKG